MLGAGGLLFRCVRYEGVKHGSGNYTLTLRLPQGYTHNPAFFRVIEACLASIPQITGHGAARVTRQPVLDGARFEVRVGTRRGVGSELATLARGIVSRKEMDSLREAHELLVARNRELEDQVGERRRATDALSESEKRFRVFSELTNDYCYMARLHDGALSCEWLTGSYAESTGFSEQELVERGLHGIVHTEDQPHVAAMLQEVATGESVVHEFRIVTRSGQVRSPLDAVLNLYGPDGKHIAGDDDSGSGPDARQVQTLPVSSLCMPR